MKLTFILLSAAMFSVHASGVSQNITLSVKQAPLEKIFLQVKEETKYVFFYKKEDLIGTSLVSIDANNLPIDQFLKQVLQDQPLKFTVEKQSIIITRKEIDLNPRLTLPSLTAPPIRGKVLDSLGRPLSGATIALKDKILGVTDAEGVFNVNVTEGDVLTVTFVGYEPRKIVVINSMFSSTNNLIITLKSSIDKLENVEVVMSTGYQEIPKERATGSFVKIDNELLNRSISTDVLTRLKGVTSGLLFAFGTENTENQRNNIVVRGYSTILANREPLIVLDNFPYDGDINNINPNDIESITVLKDAAAASIWGTRAGNGVIVITTKKGKYNQKLKTSINSNVTIAEMTDLFYAPTMKSKDFIDLEIFLFDKGFYNSTITSLSMPALTPVVETLLKRKNGEISAEDSAAQINALRNIDVRTDISKYYYREPIKQQHSINLTGGSRNQQYFLSFGYDYNLNNVSNYKRLSLNATNTYRLINEKLEITMGLWGAQTETRNFDPAYSFSYPYGQLADSNGNPLPIAKRRQSYIDTAGMGQLLDWTYYPLKERDYTDNKTNQFNYTFNLGLKYELIRNLNISIKYQYGEQQSKTNKLYGLNTYYTRDLINQFTNLGQTNSNLRNPIPIGDILDGRHVDLIYQNFRAQVGYSKLWSQKHSISAIAGFEIRDAETIGNSYRYYGYNEENGTSIPVDYVNVYPDIITNSNSPIPNGDDFVGLTNRNVSLYANAAYSFQNRYTLSASARRDGSNIFGTSTNNKWKPLWSVGGSWEISKEPFFDLDWLSNLKIKTTYGYQGNVDNSSAALLTIVFINSPLNRWRSRYARINNPPNPDLRWEKVAMVNMGVDFSFKNDRLSGSIEYFVKKGTDLLGYQTMPPSQGITSAVVNSANIKGEGFDLTLHTRNLTGIFEWYTTFLFSYAKDKVSNYKLVLTSIRNYVSGATQNPIVGKPVTALYAYRWGGLDPDNGDPQGYLNHQVNKDYAQLVNSSNFDDMVYIGQRTPPYFGSLMNTFSYCNLSLSFNITYKFGYVFRRSSIRYNSLFNSMRNFGPDAGHTDYELRWKLPGDELTTNVPSLVYPANEDRDEFYANSEVLVEKGDHIRLQDIRISYDFVRHRVSKLPIHNIRIYAYASNIGILWKANKQGIDPDYVPGNSYVNGLPGKTYAIGFKLDF